ncbi:MAG: hypothetical protein KDH97_22410, partial [Calditrichaeota bacterium]|nr:hypothetical protein [Calditrichota bacterium]
MLLNATLAKLPVNNRRYLLPIIITVLLVLFALPQSLWGAESGGSLDIPVKGSGLSIGNSKRFNGVRINFRDKHV